MSDPIATELKLEWAIRSLEEKDTLIASLRASVDGLLSQLADASTKNETLKKVQDALMREKIAAERHVESLMSEKAELASENARLHIYAKEARAQAERASRAAHEQQQFSEARSKADELLLAASAAHAQLGDVAAAHPTDRDSSQELAEARAQLQALKLVLSRVLRGLDASGLRLDCAALLMPERAGARGSVERALLRALLPQAAGPDNSTAAVSFEMADVQAAQTKGPGTPRAAGTLSEPASDSWSAATSDQSRSDAAAPAGSESAVAASPASDAGQASSDVAESTANTSWGVRVGGMLTAATLGFWAVLLGDSSNSDSPPSPLRNSGSRSPR